MTDMTNTDFEPVAPLEHAKFARQHVDSTLRTAQDRLRSFSHGRNNDPVLRQALDAIVQAVRETADIAHSAHVASLEQQGGGSPSD